MRSTLPKPRGARTVAAHFVAHVFDAKPWHRRHVVVADADQERMDALVATAWHDELREDDGPADHKLVMIM